MGRLRLSPAAKDDLDDIWDFTVKRRDASQAEVYVVALGRTLQLLAASPQLGRSIDKVRAGYFKFPAASHVVYYKVRTDGIDVIRILHKSMDAELHI